MCTLGDPFSQPGALLASRQWALKLHRVLTNCILSFKVSCAHSLICGICLSGDWDNSFAVEPSFGKSGTVNVGDNEKEWLLRHNLDLEEKNVWGNEL